MLGEKLTNEPASSGAERESDRQLFAPRCRPGEEHVDDVGASDEKQTAGRAEEREPDGPDLGHELAELGPDEHATRIALRMLFVQCAHNRSELGLGLLDLGSWGEPADAVQLVHATLRAQ